MAKNINWSATAEEAKKAIIDFKISFAEQKLENKCHREICKNLEESLSVDTRKLQSELDALNALYKKAVSEKNAEERAKLNALKREKAAEMGKRQGEYDIASKNESSRHSDENKRIAKMRDAAYNLLIPVGVTSRKQAEKWEAFYQAYLEYQTSFDVTVFGDTITTFLKNIGYDAIAENKGYQANVLKRFSAKIGQKFQSGEMVNLKPLAFVNSFLSVFSEVLVAYGELNPEDFKLKSDKAEKEETETKENTPETILGIIPGATKEDIKRAYREKVKEIHPDNGGSTEKFEEVTAAYNTLMAV